MTRTGAAATLVLTALAAPACFDVHTVEPPIFVIDDFDDGDRQPSAENFGGWICYRFSPDNNGSCMRDLDDGDHSMYSLSLAFTVADPADGIRQDSGAGLATYASLHVDLRQFLRFKFRVKLESGTPALPTNTVVDVEIGCSTALNENGDRPGNLYVLQAGHYDDTWRTIDLALADFVPPADPAMSIQGGTPSCLGQADGIRFAVHPGLPDGGTAQGILHVDNIYLE